MSEMINAIKEMNGKAFAQAAMIEMNSFSVPEMGLIEEIREDEEAKELFLSLAASWINIEATFYRQKRYDGRNERSTKFCSEVGDHAWIFQETDLKVKEGSVLDTVLQDFTVPILSGHTFFHPTIQQTFTGFVLRAIGELGDYEDPVFKDFMDRVIKLRRDRYWRFPMI